jgi:hypothetical protein
MLIARKYQTIRYQSKWRADAATVTTEDANAASAAATPFEENGFCSKTDELSKSTQHEKLTDACQMTLRGRLITVTLPLQASRINRCSLCFFFPRETADPPAALAAENHVKHTHRNVGTNECWRGGLTRRLLAFEQGCNYIHQGWLSSSRCWCFLN